MESTKLTKKDSIFLDCGCNSFSHIIKFQYWDWKDPLEDEVSVEYLLHPDHTFWGRIKSIWKYLTKDNNREGDYGSTILSMSEVIRLRDFLNGVIKTNEDNKNGKS